MTLRAEQRSITARLVRILADLWPLLDPRRVDESWPTLLGLVEQAVLTEHDAAARAAVTEYLATRTAAGVTAVFVPRQALPVLPALRTSLTVTGPVALKTALRRGESPRRASKLALVQLQGAATRHALAGARRTTLQAVADDPEVSGWARVPRPDACAFCTLLATRGGAYKSRATALTSKSGSSYHDQCGCTVQPIFGTYTPPAHVARAEELYRESTAGLSGADARHAFAAALAADRSQSSR